MMERLAVVLCLIGACLAAKCPDRPVQKEFDAESYMGTWYEVGRFGNVFEAFVRCPKAQYKLNDDGTVAVNNSGVSLFNSGTSWQATAKPVDTSKFDVTGKLPVIGASITAPYWVLGTDYTNYAVVWSCYQKDLKLFSTHSESGWILSRSREGFSEEIESQVNKVITDAGLTRNDYKNINQNGCTN